LRPRRRASTARRCDLALEPLAALHPPAVRRVALFAGSRQAVSTLPSSDAFDDASPFGRAIGRPLAQEVVAAQSRANALRLRPWDDVNNIARELAKPDILSSRIERS
jgi:hypothetical protein